MYILKFCLVLVFFNVRCETKAVKGNTVDWKEVGEFAIYVWLEREVEK